MGSNPQVIFYHYIINHSVPSTHISHQIYYNRNQMVIVLLYMIQIFGVITEYSTTNDSHRGKTVTPILHIDVNISCAFSSFSFYFSNDDLVFLCQYHQLLSWFQYIRSKHSLLNLSSLTPIFFK